MRTKKTSHPSMVCAADIVWLCKDQSEQKKNKWYVSIYHISIGLNLLPKWTFWNVQCIDSQKNNFWNLLLNLNTQVCFKSLLDNLKRKITRRTIGSKSCEFLIVYTVILIFHSNLSIHFKNVMLVKQIARCTKEAKYWQLQFFNKYDTIYNIIKEYFTISITNQTISNNI